MCRTAGQTADGQQKRCKKCNEPGRRRNRQNLANSVRRAQAALEKETKAPEETSPTPVEETVVVVTPEVVEPVEPEAVEPVEPEVVEPEPAPEPEPVEPEPAPVEPEPVEPESVEPEPVEPDEDDEDKEPQTLADALAASIKERHGDLPEGVDEETMSNTIASMLAGPEMAQKLSAAMREERESAESNRAWLLNGREDTPENLAAGIAERQEEILMVGTVVAERAQAIHGIDIEQAREEWVARIPEAKAAYDKACADSRVTAEAYTDARQAILDKYKTTYYEYEEKANAEEKANLEKLRQANNVTLEARENARMELQKVTTGKDEKTQAVLAKISDANRQAIAEVRPVGNVPVEITTAIRGGGDADKAFRAAITQTFPDDWVKKSNELGELTIVRVTSASGRAHYQPVRKTSAKYNYSMNHKPDPNDDRFRGWTERLDENGNPTGKWEGPKRDFIENRNPWNAKKFNGEKPKGAGWVRGQASGTFGPVHGWVRDNATDKKTVDTIRASGAKITVNMRESEQDRWQTNQHEFSHRVEDCNPHIPLLEEGFVASRTTQANGRRDRLERYGSSRSKEYVRSDNFVSSYIGKEYEDGNFREVLSMGSESVFGGAMGGLTGIGREKSDLEMRNWILGVYATQ